MPRVLESFERISAADLVIVEGAGSPAEINLRAGDIANMGFAEAADVPVILVGDIERGGVIAALVGTHAVLNAAENARIRGFIVNRFRGDVSLFDEGLAAITKRTGWKALGVVPHFADASKLPAEDVLGLRGSVHSEGYRRLRIAVPKLPRIANFDDLDPLAAEPAVEVIVVEPGEPIPQCELILIPGSKSTIADLSALRREGWDIDILAHRRRGGAVLGLCGGYQMLGRRIADPDGIEGPAGDQPGLGFLECRDRADGRQEDCPGHRSTSRKRRGSLRATRFTLARTRGPDCARPFLEIDGRPEGAMSPDGSVRGCYVHGLFASDGFRRAFLTELGGHSSVAYDAGVEAALDGLAAHLAAHLDLDAILAIARSRSR